MESRMIALGDFTELAKTYDCRAGYSLTVLEFCLGSFWDRREALIVADVGAGTGKLTQHLNALACRGYAIEPNEAMFEKGRSLHLNFQWSKANAENTQLDDNSVDIVIMGSAFHWTDQQKALVEFHRILKPGGRFIAVWNPRDLSACSLQREIDQWIQQQIPNFIRVSSGFSNFVQGLEKTLEKGSYFSDVVFVEGSHTEKMSRDRYLGAWKSVNDIRTQAGEETFQRIIKYIEQKTDSMNEIIVPYKTRAWVAKSTKITYSNTRTAQLKKGGNL